MGHDLGELGKDRGPVDITFGWFGVSIRVAPDANDLFLVDFLEKAAGVDTGDYLAAMAATRDFLRAQIHTEDWEIFITLARQHNQQFTDLLQLGRSIIEAVARFPTGRPSVSSDGPPNTEARSRGVFSLAELSAIAQLKGRPDLKMTIWQAHQARMADAAHN